MNEAHISGAAILVAQSRHHLLQDRKGPMSFIDLIGREPIAVFRLNALFLLDVVERNQPLSFTAFERHGVPRLIGDKILDRRKQIRTQSSLFLANSVQIFALQQ